MSFAFWLQAFVPAAEPWPRARACAIARGLSAQIGVGKTWLACALGPRRPPRQPHRALPTPARCPGSWPTEAGPWRNARFPRLFRSLVKADLLILDDWGPDRLNASQRRDLMEIVEDRCGTGSTLIPAAARRRLARGDRRADLRRCHPRSPGPQRLPPRPRRPLHAQAEGRRGNPAGPDVTTALRRVSPEIGTPRRARDPPPLMTGTACAALDHKRDD